MKRELSDIKPDPSKLASQTPSLPNAGLFSPAGIKQFKDIIESIRAMVKEAKELQNPHPSDKEPLHNYPTPLEKGVTKEQLFTFARQFLDSMVSQGYGDKTVSEAVNAIPFTVKQIRGFLK